MKNSFTTEMVIQHKYCLLSKLAKNIGSLCIPNYLPILFICLTINLSPVSSYGEIVDVVSSPIIYSQNLEPLKTMIPAITARDIVFIDIEDCVVMPTAKMFSSASGERYFLRSLRNNIKHYKPLAKPLAVFYKSARFRLVDESWPKIVSALLQKTSYVFFLSQNNPGALHDIAAMEQLEHLLLTRLGVPTTTLKLGGEDYLKLIYAAYDYYLGVYYKGVILVGHIPVSLALKEIMYIQDFIPQRIVYISPLRNNLELMQTSAEAKKIPFYGIQYYGINAFSDVKSDDFMKLQKHFLMEKLKWLEDEQIEAVIEEKRNILREQNDISH